MVERIFQRKIYDRLLAWKKESNGQSAILIQGARRIGKSTVVEDLQKGENELLYIPIYMTMLL